MEAQNKGKRWSTEEETTLLAEYEKGLGVVEIAKLHGRTPVAIASRLVTTKVIHLSVDARGYVDWLSTQPEKPQIQSQSQDGNNPTRRRTIPSAESKANQVQTLMKENAGLKETIINLELELKMKSQALATITMASQNYFTQK